MSFFLVFVVSCGQSEAPCGNDMTFDVIGVQLYNEFIPCVGGSDFNQENVDKMMKGWRALNISDDLLGAWGYVPATDTSRFDNGWWNSHGSQKKLLMLLGLNGFKTKRQWHFLLKMNQ